MLRTSGRPSEFRPHLLGKDMACPDTQTSDGFALKLAPKDTTLCLWRGRW